MAKRARKLDIDKRIKEGYGVGSGQEYKPWIKIQDLGSKGRSSRFKGIKTGRQHDVLSDMERNYLNLLEYSDYVLDIKEQYPLQPLSETLSIAKELGIEHPKNRKTGEYIVMTTDFFISIKQDENLIDVARTIKSKDDLLNRRIIEKFEIERIYWERRGISWAIVTEDEINKTIAENIIFFNSYYNIDMLDSFSNIESTEVTDLVLEYIRRIIDSTETVRVVSSLFDRDMSLPKGTGISLFKHLLARKVIKIDITESINIDKKVDVEISNDALSKEFKTL
ncbi:heteromeric transposase endonuclease subunit TnsA [Clostridium sp. P21]|uniref:Heteromeric transposase endonuclease subunit TnsA n=1 Tax=Clostridium muellerianum TaxID=2716538 RepID=A0A7Y0HNN4_9CLOT|nr:TnsA endonuclease N-terminal domain-containing protein [Clostridium muellerianum]NMM62206.1 heteromeric transposase endonuclease subunit TnsA [Clostridium muellerianum]